MTALDAASLVFYPSGYKESKLYSIKPTPKYGAEEITNGNPFVSGSWTLGSGVTVSLGKLLFTAVNSGANTSQDAGLTIGKYYDFTFTISSRSSGGIRIYMGGSGASANVYSSNGTFTETVLCQGNSSFYFSTSGTTNLTIDSVSVKEVITAPADLTFTRASSATRVNAQGVIESVTSNIPRIDYTGGGCGSLLLESQSTNLLTYSEAFDNAAWTKIGASVTSGFTSPDGSTNAFKLVESATAGEHYLEDTVSATTNNTYTQSIFVKQFTADYGFIISVIGIGSSSTVSSAKFNILNGLVSTGTIGGLITSSKVTLLTNGQYKCSVTYTLNGTVTSHRMRIRTGTSLSYTGDGTSGLYIYGAQLELGSYATSYIPTSGTSVTRIAERSITTGLSSVINSTEGVLYAELQNDELGRVTISDGTYNNVVMVQLGGVAAAIVFKIGGSSSSISGTGVLGFNKLAIKWDATNIKMFLNGVLIGTSPTGSTFAASTLNSLQFNRGDGSSSGQFFGNCQNLIIFPTALTDEQLTDLTGTVHTTFNSLALSLGYTIL
jgi:hypothetical protein